MDHGAFLAGGIGIAGQTVFFGLMSWTTFRHFNGDRPTVGFSLVKALSAGAFVGLSGFWIWQGPTSLAESAISLSLAIAAHVVFLIAWRQTQTGTFDVVFSHSQPERLVTGGVYAWSRNPFYTSYLLYWAAWIPLLGWSWIAWSVLAVFAGVYLTAARQEERRLAATFGTAYAKYRAEVPRFLLSPLRCVRRTPRDLVG